MCIFFVSTQEVDNNVKFVSLHSLFSSWNSLLLNRRTITAATITTTTCDVKDQIASLSASLSVKKGQTRDLILGRRSKVIGKRERETLTSNSCWEEKNSRPQSEVGEVLSFLWCLHIYFPFLGSHFMESEFPEVEWASLQIHMQSRMSTRMFMKQNERETPFEVTFHSILHFWGLSRKWIHHRVERREKRGKTNETSKKEIREAMKLPTGKRITLSCLNFSFQTLSSSSSSTLHHRFKKTSHRKEKRMYGENEDKVNDVRKGSKWRPTDKVSLVNNHEILRNKMTRLTSRSDDLSLNTTVVLMSLREE